MTALGGSIKFNSGTGSDTAASGYASTASLSGTGAALDGTSTVDLSADTPDLSSVAAGDLLWVDASSGRQFSVIASVDDGADTVTCDDSFTPTESSRNWGIGGKRATLNNANSQKLLNGTEDAKPGWTLEIEDDQTLSGNYLVIGVAGDVTNGPITIRGAAGAIRRITQASNTRVLYLSSCVNVRFENLKIECSNATANVGVYAVNSRAQFVNCEIGDESNQLSIGVHRGAGTVILDFVGCWIHHCTSNGFTSDNASVQFTLVGSVVSDNGGDGFSMDHGAVSLRSSIVRDNSAKGIDLDNVAIVTASQCTIHGNGEDGVELGTGQNRGWLVSCNITGNGGYGVDSPSGAHEVYLDYNNYGTGSTANTSGAVNGVSQGPNDLSVDPGYADAGNGDFSVGANVKAQGFPGAFPDGNSTGYLDIGAVQREEPAGGGGVMIPQGLHPISQGITA